jgi:hypothetical protein
MFSLCVIFYLNLPYLQELKSRAVHKSIPVFWLKADKVMTAFMSFGSQVTVSSLVQ